MKLIGWDYHPSFQQIALVDRDSGEYVELRRLHAGGEAQRFYEARSGPVRVGVESSGNPLWCERRLQRLGHEMGRGMGAPSGRRLRANRRPIVRDARHLLPLRLEHNFPRIWVPRLAERDLRPRLKHRHTRVQRRPRGKNQWQHIALNQGMQKKGKLGTRAGQELLRGLERDRWTARRRDDRLPLRQHLEGQIGELDQAVTAEAGQRAEAQLLMTHAGVGPGVGLATGLTLGEVSRFPRGREGAAYVGLIPSEDSRGPRRRWGAIPKQGNVFLRFLRVQAAGSAGKGDAGWARTYKRWPTKSTPVSPRWRSLASWGCGGTGCCGRIRGIPRWFACRAARVIR
jgi:transposase